MPSTTGTGQDWPHDARDDGEGDEGSEGSEPPTALDVDMLEWLRDRGFFRPPGMKTWTWDYDMDIADVPTEPSLRTMPAPTVPIIPPHEPPVPIVPPVPSLPVCGPSPHVVMLAEHQAVMLAAFRSDASVPAPLRVLRWVSVQMGWLLARLRPFSRGRSSGVREHTS